jgi:putative MATE family efflux protein
LGPLASVIDSALIGRFDTNWLAALALCQSLFDSFSWIFNFLIHTTTSAISEAYGKKDEKAQAELIKVSMIVASFLGVFCLIILFVGKEILLEMVGLTTPLKESAYEYYVYRVWGIPFVILTTALIGILRGLQQIQAAFWLGLIVTLSNAFISYFLLYEKGYGIKGAALGSSLSFVLGCLFGVLYLCFNSETKKLLPYLKGKVGKGGWPSFGKDSWDFFGRSFFLSGSFLLSTALASRLGVIALAAHQICLQLWLLISFFIDGLAISANVLGAKFLGAKKVEQAKESYIKLGKISLAFGLIFSLGYFLFPYEVIGIFTKDDDVIAVILSFWTVLSLSQLTNSLTYITDGAVFGMRAYAFVRKHIMIGVFFLILPCFALALELRMLVWIWVGFSLLNVYRSIFNIKKANEVLIASNK